MPLDKQLLLKVLLCRKLRRKLKRKPRSVSIRPIFYNRFVQGESVLVRELRDDEQYHHRYFRMNKSNFDEILNLVTPFIQKPPRHIRPISPTEKLALTLRFLASGSSQISLAMSYRISPSSVSKLLRETMEAICATLGDKHLPAPSAEIWAESELGFRTKWNFPNCCGSLDGKHIRIRAPSHSGSQNFNYKGYLSTVLLGIVDPFYRFIAVDIGASGSQSDGGVLARSAIGQALDRNELGFPEDMPIMENSDPLPLVIVGDEAFPLKRNLMRPFPGKNLTVQRRIYNYRQSRARMVVENSFGILAVRWRIFLTQIQGDPEFVKLLIRTCVILHNYLINKNYMDGLTPDADTQGVRSLGSWRNNLGSGESLQSLPPQGSNNYTASASDVREKFMEYFNGQGAVDWQMQMI